MPAVARLPGGQVEGDRQAAEVGLEMDLGREAAARAAESLAVLPPHMGWGLSRGALASMGLHVLADACQDVIGAGGTFGSTWMPFGVGWPRGQAPKPCSGAPQAQGLTARTRPTPFSFVEPSRDQLCHPIPCYKPAPASRSQGPSPFSAMQPRRRITSHPVGASGRPHHDPSCTRASGSEEWDHPF